MQTETYLESKLDEIRKSITMQAPIKLVWDFITDPEKIAQWLMPNDFKATKGAEFGMQCMLKDGSAGQIPAKVIEIEPTFKLVYSWQVLEPVIDTIVSITLRETDNGTKLDLIHSGWSQLLVQDEEVRTLHDNVWSMLLEQKLKGLVESTD